MATVSNDFRTSVASVAANCEEIDSYIRNTFFIKRGDEQALTSRRYNSSKPYRFLKELRRTNSWKMYFSHVIDLIEEDKMSDRRLNVLIERLSAPAARLDVLVPNLERQGFSNKAKDATIHAREMYTCVNSFLNSADNELNLWKRSKSESYNDQPSTTHYRI